MRRLSLNRPRQSFRLCRLLCLDLLPILKVVERCHRMLWPHPGIFSYGSLDLRSQSTFAVLRIRM